MSLVRSLAAKRLFARALYREGGRTPIAAICQRAVAGKAHIVAKQDFKTPYFTDNVWFSTSSHRQVPSSPLPYEQAESEELTFSLHEKAQIADTITTITETMKDSLEQMGYTLAQIEDMIPLEAALILQNSLVPSELETHLPGLVDEHNKTIQALRSDQSKNRVQQQKRVFVGKSDRAEQDTEPPSSSPYEQAENEELNYSVHGKAQIADSISTITETMKDSLEQMGYSPNHIKDMSPLEAALILQNGIKPFEFDKKLPGLVEEHNKTI